MIRKIYTTLIAFACTALTLTSCSDWLDLYPQDEIKEEYLFSTGTGYRTALNGIYRKMSTFDLYGSNLTWGLMDAWAQCYYKRFFPKSGGGKAMEKISNFDFKNVELLPTTNSLWRAAWNVVANCNELAQKAETADPNIFSYLDWERKMILGEAIGLRAFVQFDLLRIYAPAPSSVGFKEDSRVFIPYVDVYPSYVNNHQTVTYCLDKIIADLKRAQEIMQEVDKDVDFSKTSRFNILAVSDKQFFGSRGYRLNYYAVTAELARVYLYAGKMKEAAEEALKIIEEENKTAFFKGATSPSDFKNGNMKMYDDIIFGLYSPTELVDWDKEINHSNEDLFLGIDSKVAKSIYGDEIQSDWRFKYQLEEVNRGRYYRTLKYNKQSESQNTGQTNNCLIPMIRMSEVYYIAAEALFDTNRSYAQYYLQLAKYYRGVNKSFYDVNDKSKFIDLILNDARREFFGEGQLLFMYKRLNTPIYPCKLGDENLLPTDENMVLPKPDSESNI